MFNRLVPEFLFSDPLPYKGPVKIHKRRPNVIQIMTLKIIDFEILDIFLLGKDGVNFKDNFLSRLQG